METNLKIFYNIVVKYICFSLIKIQHKIINNIFLVLKAIWVAADQNLTFIGVSQSE